MTKRAFAILVDTLLGSSTAGAQGQTPAYDAAYRACSEEWYASEFKMLAKPDDTHDPRTGKLLSQTEGAKRTRERKLKAAHDAHVLTCLKGKLG